MLTIERIIKEIQCGYIIEPMMRGIWNGYRELNGIRTKNNFTVLLTVDRRKIRYCVSIHSILV